MIDPDQAWAMAMLSEAGERLAARCERLEVLREGVGVLLLTASEATEILDGLRWRRAGDPALRQVLIEEFEAFIAGVKEGGEDANS